MGKILNVPLNVDPMHSKFLQQVKDIVEQLPESGSVPPGPATNLKVIPGPGLNVITWTAGANANKHHLYVSTKPAFNPTIADNHVMDVGQSTMHTHNTGIPAQDYYYWVAAFVGNLKSPVVGPVKGTTLVLGTAPSPPAMTRQAPGNVTVGTGGIPVINLPNNKGRYPI